MDFGIVFPSYLDAWKDAAIAEDHGFTHAWFYDSHLLYSDVYVGMALAAEHTRQIELGTAVAATLPEELRAGYPAYAQAYIGTLQTPEDRRYQEVHEGHLIYLKPGEERFLTEPLMKRGGLIGSGEEIVAQLKALEQTGLRQIAVQVVTNGRELIEEFSREVIARYR